MSEGLYFDIDIDRLDQLVMDLQATEKQVKFALSRAAARTATRLRTLSARLLKDELALRTVGLLRKRLKTLRLRKVQEDGFVLWFGLNDMPVSWFKGTPQQTSDGAQFRGNDFKGGFVAKSNYKNRRTIFKRAGSGRLPIVEQLLGIGDQAQTLVEDKIFALASDIFWKEFERDLNARMKYGVGNKNDRHS